MHAPVFLQELPGQRQLLPGGSGCKAGGYGISQPPLSMPALDQLSALLITGLCRIEQLIRGIAVHHHFPTDHSQVAGPGDVKKCFNGLGVNRSEDQGGGGSVSKQFVNEKFRRGKEGLFVPETGFDRESVVVQPVDQLCAIRCDDVYLGIMNVGIDEAGYNQRVGMRINGYAVRQPRDQVPCRSALGHMTFFNDQQAVFKVLFRGVLAAGRTMPGVIHEM